MSRGGCSGAEQGPRREDRDLNISYDQFTAAAKPDSPVSHIGPFGFSWFWIEEDFMDYHARVSTDTLLVSSRTHTQPEEEDPRDEGTEAEGRSS
jgi:hypothetical protein